VEKEGSRLSREMGRQQRVGRQRYGDGRLSCREDRRGELPDRFLIPADTQPPLPSTWRMHRVLRERLAVIGWTFQGHGCALLGVLSKGGACCGGVGRSL
jgi:hypothetical protein